MLLLALFGLFSAVLFLVSCTSPTILNKIPLGSQTERDQVAVRLFLSNASQGDVEYPHCTAKERSEIAEELFSRFRSSNGTRTVIVLHHGKKSIYVFDPRTKNLTISRDQAASSREPEYPAFWISFHSPSNSDIIYLLFGHDLAFYVNTDSSSVVFDGLVMAE